MSPLRVLVLTALVCWATPHIVANAGRTLPNLSNVRLTFRYVDRLLILTDDSGLLDKAHERCLRSYILGGGLCNQQLGQITGLLLGQHLQVDTIYVPPPYFRDSFSKEFVNTTWTLLEHSALWDMASIKALLQKHNQTLVENIIDHNLYTERGAAVPKHATEQQVRVPTLFSRQRSRGSLLTVHSDCLPS